MNHKKLEIKNIRQVYGNGAHNAFTDLIHFKERFYLAFRSSSVGHSVNRQSKILVFSSPDTIRWEKCHEFSVPDRDTRDPHFLAFKDKLFVYSGTWFCPDGLTEFDINDHLGYAIWTTNGTDWQGPRSLEGTYGHYIWRAASCGDRAFLCGRRKQDFNYFLKKSDGAPETKSVMLESEDGLIWRFNSFFRETYGDETAFFFRENKEVVALARTLEGKNAWLCHSPAPYKKWSYSELDRYVGGPLICQWGDAILAGGRKQLPGEPPKTTLYWVENNQLVEIAELPSGGDNSYPGFIPLDNRHGLLSYYSSHEGTKPNEANIYLADLRIV